MPARSKEMSGRIKAAQSHPVGPATDLFSALAPLLKVRPVLDDLCRFGGTWEAPHAQAGDGSAYFHIVTRGTCRVETDETGVITLGAGDVLLLPHGVRHVVLSRRKGAAGRVKTEFRNAIRAKSIAGVEADTELICGRLWFE